MSATIGIDPANCETRDRQRQTLSLLVINLVAISAAQVVCLTGPEKPPCVQHGSRDSREPHLGAGEEIALVAPRREVQVQVALVLEGQSFAGTGWPPVNAASARSARSSTAALAVEMHLQAEGRRPDCAIASCRPANASLARSAGSYTARVAHRKTQAPVRDQAHDRAALEAMILGVSRSSYRAPRRIGWRPLSTQPILYGSSAGRTLRGLSASPIWKSFLWCSQRFPFLLLSHLLPCTRGRKP